MTYRATKAAVIHLTRSIAIDLAEHGIRVNCVAPAHIPTDDQRVATTSRRSCGSCSRCSASGRRSDVANAVLYLASDRAAQVTGIVLPVDGGTTAGPPDGRRSRTSSPTAPTRRRSRRPWIRRPASTPATTTSISPRCRPTLWESRLPRAQAERGPRVVDARRQAGLGVRGPRDRPQRHAATSSAVAKSLSAIGRAGIEDDGYRAGTPEAAAPGHGPRRPVRPR